MEAMLESLFVENSGIITLISRTRSGRTVVYAGKGAYRTWLLAQATVEEIRRRL
jgi:hypothetical protein